MFEYNATNSAMIIHQMIRDWFLSEARSTTPTSRRNVVKEDMEDPPDDPHMILFDFGRQVHPRTHGEKRIVGDQVHHLGPEARTLSMQILSHEMHKAKCRKKG